jgi:hypothetical protein
MQVTRIFQAVALLFCLPLTSAMAQSVGNVAEERVIYDHGVVRVCGEGEGLSPCLDANGQTYAQEVLGPNLDSESESEMAAGAARIRGESPEQLEQTISEMEKGYNPDTLATEGLPN